MKDVFKRNIPNIFLIFGSAISLSMIICLAYFFLELPGNYFTIAKYWLYLSVLFFLHLLIILLIFEIFFYFYKKDKNIEIFNRIQNFANQYMENSRQFLILSFALMISTLVLCFCFSYVNNIFLSGSLVFVMYILYSISLPILFVYFFVKNYEQSP